MRALFLLGIVLGFAGTLAAAHWVPWISHQRLPSQTTVVATGVPFDIAEVHRWTVHNGRAVAAHFSIDTPAMLRALAAG